MWGRGYFFYGRRGRGGICGCAAVFLILGFVFVYLFINETRKFATYENTTCQVISSYLTNSVCSRSCGSGCTRTYTCYYANWDVYYTIDNNTISDTIREGTYKSYSSANSALYDYSLGSSYSCWYDSTDYIGVQWNKPNPFVYAIVLAIMFIVAVAFIILFVYVIKKCNQTPTATTTTTYLSTEQVDQQPVPVVQSYPVQPYPAQPYPTQPYPVDPSQPYPAQYIAQPAPAPVYPPLPTQPQTTYV